MVTCLYGNDTNRFVCAYSNGFAEIHNCIYQMPRQQTGMEPLLAIINFFQHKK